MMGTTQNIAWVYHNTGLPIFLWHLWFLCISNLTHFQNLRQSLSH
jgi:hypothetical protein